MKVRHEKCAEEAIREAESEEGGLDERRRRRIIRTHCTQAELPKKKARSVQCLALLIRYARAWAVNGEGGSCIGVEAFTANGQGGSTVRTAASIDAELWRAAEALIETGGPTPAANAMPSSLDENLLLESWKAELAARQPPGDDTSMEAALVNCALQQLTDKA